MLQELVTGQQGNRAQSTLTVPCTRLGTVTEQRWNLRRRLLTMTSIAQALGTFGQEVTLNHVPQWLDMARAYMIHRFGRG